MSGARQDELLGKLDAGAASGFTPDSATFFTTLLSHAMQGMFGDPSYGGNANFAGWDLIGFPGIYAITPQSYTRLSIRVPRGHRSVAQFDGMFDPKRPVADYPPV